MKTTAALSALALVNVTLAEPAPRVLHMDVSRQATPQPLARRASSATASLLNNVSASAYVVTVQVGTPAQTLTLQLDTGSSDTWVTGVDASICESGGCFYGSFDSSSSSTFTDEAQDEFKIQYGDGTSSTGDYFTDVFTIGDASLKSLVMGLGTETDIPFGLVGVGYPSNEAIEQVDPDSEYLNLPLELVNEGIISTVAYSLWLNDLDAKTGSILFGGIDTEKYHGDLTRLTLYPSSSPPNITEFIVAMTGVTAVSSSGSDKLGSSSFPMAVLLDSGTTFTSLPVDLVDEIYTEIGAIVDSSGDPLVACKLAQSKGTFAFEFGGSGGAVVNVSMSELIIDNVLGKLPSGQFKGEDACQFAIYPVSSSSDPFILGDAFLRSAYVVYDLMNDEVAMAQTDFNATASNVVEFSSLGAAIPSSTPAPSQDSAGLSAAAVTATPTAYAAQKGFTTTSSSASALVTSRIFLAGVTAFTVGFSFFLL